MAVGPLVVGRSVSSSKTVTLQPNASQASNYGMNFPISLPSASAQMLSDASGNLSFNVITFTSEASLPTITWNGSPAPSTVSSSGYKWTQNGKLVTLMWRIKYTNAGNSIISAIFQLPSDCPTPVAWTAGGSAGAMYVGAGTLFGASFSGGQLSPQPNIFLDYNDLISGQWAIGLLPYQAANSVQGYYGTVQYPTS
jgi:hypothetical protein